MKPISVMLILLCLGLAALGDQKEDRAKLFGAWILQNGRGGATVWILKDVAAGLHITETEGAETVADFECTLGGRDCDVKVSGHKATVSMYYNGAALVELETIGSKVLKRRFSILPSGTSMKLEELPMTGTEPAKGFQFEREQLPVSKQ